RRFWFPGTMRISGNGASRPAWDGHGRIVPTWSPNRNCRTRRERFYGDARPREGKEGPTMHPTAAAIHRASRRTDPPALRAGDTVGVDFKVIEGNKERVQTFTGVVIQRRGTGVSETFTVRKISSNVPVERIFPLHSPRI